jgi:hypothetical protein
MRQPKALAVREGKPVRQVIEGTLRHDLGTRRGRAGVVASTWGALCADAALVRAILEEGAFLRLDELGGSQGVFIRSSGHLVHWPS